MASTPRSKRPYAELGSTEKWKRRKKARAAVAAVLETVGVPMDAIQPPVVPSPVELIHLPTAVREQIRSVPSLHIPSEQSMIQCKQQFAHLHATETGTFAKGAYLTDPLRFVSTLCAQSSFLAVGGDTGDQHHQTRRHIQRAWPRAILKTTKRQGEEEASVHSTLRFAAGT